MPKHKKGFNRKLSDFTYAKPALGNRMLELRKGFQEIASMLEVKERKR